MIVDLNLKKIKKFTLGIVAVSLMVLAAFFVFSQITKKEDPAKAKDEILNDAFGRYRDVATQFESLGVEIFINGEFAQKTIIDSENKILYTKSQDLEIYVTEDESYTLVDGVWYKLGEEGNDFDNVKDIAIGSSGNSVDELIKQIDFDAVEFLEESDCEGTTCYKYLYTPEGQFPIEIQITKNSRELVVVNYQLEDGGDILVNIEYSANLTVPSEALETSETLESMSDDAE